MISATPLATAFIPPANGGTPATPSSGPAGSSSSASAAEAADFGRELQGAMDPGSAVKGPAERGPRADAVPPRSAAGKGAATQAATQGAGATVTTPDTPSDTERPNDAQADEEVDLSDLGFMNPEGTPQALAATVVPSRAVTEPPALSARPDGAALGAAPTVAEGTPPTGVEGAAKDAARVDIAAARHGQPDAMLNAERRWHAAAAGKEPTAKERAADPQADVTGVASPAAGEASSSSTAWTALSASHPARLAEPASATGAVPSAAAASLSAGPGSSTAAVHRSDPSLPAAVADAAVATPIDHPAFVPAFSARIATLVRDGVEQARVRLNPLDMGPVAVQLALDGTQVRVDLAAEVAATRQLLEQSLPSLAGALREAGFTLSGGGVFQQSRQGFGDDGAHASRADRDGEADLNDNVGALSSTPSPARTPTRGLVDVFA